MNNALEEAFKAFERASIKGPSIVDIIGLAVSLYLTLCFFSAAAR